MNTNQPTSLAAHNFAPSFPKTAPLPLSNSLPPPVPLPKSATLLTHRSSRGSVSNIVTAFEIKKNDQSTTKVPSPAPSLQPSALLESKHLAFLKGLSSSVTTAPTSSVTILDVPVKNADIQVLESRSIQSAPVKKADFEVLESHSIQNSPVPEENAQQHAQTDTDENVQQHAQTDTDENAQPHAQTDTDGDEEVGREPSIQLSEPDEKGEVASTQNDEDPEDHETQSEKEDDGEESEKEDQGEEELKDNQNEDLSVEVISSKSDRTLSHKLHAERHLSYEDEFNPIRPSSKVVQSDLVKTPRNIATKPSSPVSTGFMGVFKAGAALATSWTTSKPKPELKSLQLAAAAAKKDQDEKERKATLKEERRLMAAEKKQAEEKVKAGNEKRAKLAEAEKKKQEQEETSKARTGLKSKLFSTQQSATQQSSATEEAAKKRKMENEPSRFLDKKAKPPQQADSYNPTKLPSSAQKTTSSYLPTRTASTAPGSAMKATGSKHAAGSTSTIRPPPIQQHKPNPPSRPTSQASQYNKGMNGKTTGSQLKSSQASQSQSVTATTSKNNQKVVVKTGKTKKIVEKEEYIELPDIDSEYSDDDESEHERKEAKLPDWAQSPALREALANQRKVNPDDVFGGSIPPPRMEEIFRDRASKFRHRTSSANWTGADGLTKLEEAEYAKRMGYLSKNSIKK